jgi:hypothetical protein
MRKLLTTSAVALATAAAALPAASTADRDRHDRATAAPSAQVALMPTAVEYAVMM